MIDGFNKYIRPFVTCAVAVGSYFLLAFIAISFIPNVLLSTIVSDGLFAVLLFLYYKYSVHDKKVRYGFSGHLLLFVLLIFVWLFAQITFVYINKNTDGGIYESYKLLSDSDSWLYVLLSVIVAPITEELLMRGIVFNELKKVFPIGVAYLLSSLAFAIMHGTIAHLFLSFVSGLLFAIAYEYTGKIISPIIYHSVFNLLSILGTGIGLPDILFEPAVFVTIDVFIIILLGLFAYNLYTKRCERRLFK